ncbi:MAG: AMP-binding protein [Acidimicrobiales bacterium]
MLDRIANALQTGKTIIDTGLLRPTRPSKVLRAAYAVLRYGPTTPGLVETGAVLYPDRTSIVDELGTVSFAELNQTTNAIADALAADGVGEGDRIGVLCRNHRGFVEASVAAAKLGADVLYLNTGFAAPQLRDVMAREGADTLVYDGEFAGIVGESGFGGRRLVAWWEGGSAPDALLSDLAASGNTRDRLRPRRQGRTVILTSGTTGTPKGAQRGGAPRSLHPAAALLEKIPLRAEGVTVIGPPLFHAWAMAHHMVAMALGSTMVLRRRFDPETVLALIAENRADTLVLVPVMLQRLLELPEEVRRSHDTSCLRIIALSGSQLNADVATRGLDEFGPVLYNMYGSTEVAWATIATPEDLRAAPGCAGRPPRGTTVRLYDDEGKPVTEPGVVGRIFAANDMSFEGYTGGGGKQVIDGLLSIGDVGYFDEGGRLFVRGRDDDMIVSGGENVFPQEVEELLVGHEAVADASVVGVDDEAFGQRLAAAVVLRSDHRLTEDDVKGYVKSNLAGYKVPRDVVFVDELPRNPTGKVLKKDVRALFDSGPD